jgi:hypothetical protein
VSEGWDVPCAEPIGSELAEAGQQERAELTAAFAASLRLIVTFSRELERVLRERITRLREAPQGG